VSPVSAIHQRLERVPLDADLSAIVDVRASLKPFPVSILNRIRPHPEISSDLEKSDHVLSVHVTDFPAAMDPDFYRYQAGRVAVLSWRRGRWEDAIMVEKAAPVSIVEVFGSAPRPVDGIRPSFSS